MKNKEYLKKYLIQILVTIIVFLVLFLFVNQTQDKEYKKNFNYKINAILDVVQEKYPNITKDELVYILNSKHSEGNILADYGYDLEKDFYIDQNNKLNLKYNIVKIIILFLTFVSIIYIFVKSHFKSDKEIEKIIKCIEKINYQY